MEYYFEIPMAPVSVNKLYKHRATKYGTVHTYKNQEAEDFQNVTYYSTDRLDEPMEGIFELSVTFILKDMKKLILADTDNMIKNTQDALVYARIIKDDRYIFRLKDIEKRHGPSDMTIGIIRTIDNTFFDLPSGKKKTSRTVRT